MTADLWTWPELVAASGGRADGDPGAPITGVSIDTRSLQPGDVFVALKDQRDGHEFVPAAFKAGAAAAIVSDDYVRAAGDGALLRAADVLVALENIGVAARARLSANARVIAVTGSAGKTGTKEMLRACLGKLGSVHASEKSYNNHWGVPLTLARMPRDVRAAVFEIGMNHAGEIRPLTKMVRPHAAIVTTVEAVHIENFADVGAVADAKGEIFEGLVPGGTAIIKASSPHAERLTASAARCGARVSSFGLDGGADVSASEIVLSDDGSAMIVDVQGKRYDVKLAMPGQHLAENALAVIAALEAIGADVSTAVTALATLAPPGGRGERTLFVLQHGTALLIDESYNANPASMRAALAALSAVSRDRFQRRVAVLGDMLELGPQAPDMHRDLNDAVVRAGVDLVFACGSQMKNLYDSIPAPIQGGYFATAGELGPELAAVLRSGDVVMIKGSNGIRLGAVVADLKSRYGKAAAG